MTTRPTEWPRRLAAFLHAKERAPFAWGANDCCTFTADWIAALHGVDPAAGLRGTYDSALSAARLLEAIGGVDGITDATCAENDWPEVSVRLAQRGDIVIYPSESGPMAGVCCGALAAFPGKTNLVYFPTLRCARAWRI